MNKGIAIAGIGLAIVGIVALTRKVGAEKGECLLATAQTYHYVTWLGSTKKLPDAFGDEAWSVIYTVDQYDPEMQEWWPVPPPSWEYIIHHGDYVRFIVQQDVVVCGFRQQ